MCGILAVFRITGNVEINRRELLRLSRLLRHRGPDSNSVYVSSDGSVFLCHERLSIVDITDSGRQPFVLETAAGHIAWATNSEIYNHEAIRSTQLADVQIPSGSDSAVLGYLYNKYGPTNEMVQMLDGIFACVLHDARTGEFVAFRDPIGICPLYWGTGHDGAIWFASELKAIQEKCVDFEIFPPGHIFRSSDGQISRWFKPNWLDTAFIPRKQANLTELKDALIRSVVKRLMSDAPLGMLLSGGLDSSLVASIAVRHINESNNAYHKNERLHTFSIGIKGSPDLVAARKVAKFLGTFHHEFHFTVDEGIDAIKDLIWHSESFEQVRAAVPMYLLARKIKALGIKVVLSGEGADEIFGGYLYFHKAPSPEEFHRETVRKVTRLHQWDVLRANKAPFAWGLETRVPFLDKDFLQIAMNIDPKEKVCDMQDKPDGLHARMEKYVLRKAFDDPDFPYLPASVLFRQKEQFSDGVGYDWVSGLKEYAQKIVTPEMWELRRQRFPLDPPRTREYYLLRSIFEQHFPSQPALMTVPRGKTVACSTPEAVDWVPEWKNLHEISGRAIGVHEQSTVITDENGKSVPIPIRKSRSMTAGKGSWSLVSAMSPSTNAETTAGMA